MGHLVPGVPKMRVSGEALGFSRMDLGAEGGGGGGGGRAAALVSDTDGSEVLETVGRAGVEGAGGR